MATLTLPSDERPIEDGAPRPAPAAMPDAAPPGVLEDAPPAAAAAPDLSPPRKPQGIEAPPTDFSGFTATDDLPSFSERYAAGWLQRTVETDMWGYSSRVSGELTDQLMDALPEEAQARLAPEFQRLEENESYYTPSVEAKRALILDELARLNPEAQKRSANNLPMTEEGFQAEVLKRRRAAYDEAQAVLDVNGAGFGGFLGGVARDIVDPINLALAPIGVQGSAARVIAAETVLGGVAAAASLPREFQVADELDLPRPNVAARITTEALASGALAGVFTGVVRGAAAYRQRKEAQAYGKPDGISAQQHERQLAEAQDQLSDEPPAPTRTATYIATPAGWPEIRNGIFAGESGGDYNALFNYQNRAGGRFEHVSLTEMTVDEAIAFSLPDAPYARWVKGQIGRVATPMGAYQIVGTTLRAAKKGLMLTGREKMTPDLQDQLGMWIYRTQGTGAWVGYRGPRNTAPTPSGGAAPRSDFSGYVTREGYTSQGQVRTAGGMRIDADYVVVDASVLTRATGDLQPRDRSQGNSDAWISDTAATLDPALLMPGPTVDRGAPIIGPDNVIESGNGRVAAIQRAAELFPDRMDAYRQQIEAAGFEIPEGVETPVLVGRRTSELTPDERRAFVVEGQDSGVARMTPVERSRAEAAGLSSDTLSRLVPGKSLTDAENADFARAALARLPRSERNAYLTPEGRLNADGRDALERALFARAFNDPELLRRFTERDAAELRSLMDALFEASPAWARLVADLADGTVKREFDITGHVVEAMRLIAAARKDASAEGRKTAQVLTEMLDDVDLIEGAVSPLTRALVGRFWKGGKAAQQKDIAQFLTRYANEARRVGRADAGLFGDGPDALDALRAVDPGTFDDIPEIGPARGVTQAPEPDVSEVIPEGRYTEGAASRDAVQADALAEEELRAAVAPREAASDGGAPPAPEDTRRPAAEALQRAVAARRDEVAAMRSAALSDGDFEVPTEGGRTIMASELLDDIENDQVLDTIVGTCTARGAA